LWSEFNAQFTLKQSPAVFALASDLGQFEMQAQARKRGGRVRFTAVYQIQSQMRKTLNEIVVDQHVETQVKNCQQFGSAIIKGRHDKKRDWYSGADPP
jgi:predicted LPLAT superfamily acyltransferase